MHDRAGIENAEFVTILSELGSILATFMVINRIVRFSYFSKLFQPPVVLDRN